MEIKLYRIATTACKCTKKGCVYSNDYQNDGIVTQGKIKTEGKAGTVKIVGEIETRPKNFKPYEFKKGDTCWCMWQKRTQKAITWARAYKECKNTCKSGNPDKTQIGEIICVPE